MKVSVQTRTHEGKWVGAGEVALPARTIFVAAGTQPNTVLAREDAAHFALDERYFQAIDEAGNPVRPEKSIAKPNQVRVLLGRRPDGRCISYFALCIRHSSVTGEASVAKQGYRSSSVFRDVEPASASLLPVLDSSTICESDRYHSIVLPPVG